MLKNLIFHLLQGILKFIVLIHSYDTSSCLIMNTEKTIITFFTLSHQNIASSYLKNNTNIVNPYTSPDREKEPFYNSITLQVTKYVSIRQIKASPYSISCNAVARLLYLYS